MDFKQETNAFETKLEDLKFQLKSCETTIYDFREEYRTKIALLNKENTCLILERDKLLATESELVKKLVEEKSQLSSTNFNLREENITYQLKVAHLKNVLIEYEKSFNNQLEDLELINKKYLNENSFLKENNQVLESKLSTLPDQLNILQEEKDKALTFATSCVARLKEFEDNLKQEKMENKRKLDFKDEQYKNSKIAQVKEINELNLKLEDAELKRQDLVKRNESSIKELQDNLVKLKLEFDQLNGANSNDKAELIILKQILKQQEEYKTNQQKIDTKNQDKVYSLECEIMILSDEISCLKRSNLKLNDQLSELINENEILNIKLTNEDISITKMIKDNKQKEADLENLRTINQNLNNRISKQNEDIEQLLSRNKFLKDKESFTNENLIKEKSNLKYCRSVIKPLETKKSELYKKLRSKKSQLETSRSLFNKLNDEFNILMNKYEEMHEENKRINEQNNLIIQRLQEENKFIKLKYESLNMKKRKCVSDINRILIDFQSDEIEIENETQIQKNVDINLKDSQTVIKTENEMEIEKEDQSDISDIILDSNLEDVSNDICP